VSLVGRPDSTYARDDEAGKVETVDEISARLSEILRTDPDVGWGPGET
jgi:hypothetical protein